MKTLKQSEVKRIVVRSFEKKDFPYIFDVKVKVIFRGTKSELMEKGEEFMLSILPVRYSKSYSKLGKDGFWYDTKPYPEELYNFRQLYIYLP